MIISGGQTGADQGGLEAAEALGILTGGQIPKGCRTEVGNNYAMARRFNLVESKVRAYRPRTLANVRGSDGTLIFGDLTEPGSALTMALCQQYKKPWAGGVDCSVEQIRAFIETYGIKVLNVAGNRESKRPGLQAAVRALLIAAIAGEEPGV